MAMWTWQASMVPLVLALLVGVWGAMALLVICDGHLLRLHLHLLRLLRHLLHLLYQLWLLHQLHQLLYLLHQLRLLQQLQQLRLILEGSRRCVMCYVAASANTT